MVVIRLFSVLDEVVCVIEVQERTTDGTLPFAPPRHVAHAQAALDEVSDVRGLTRMVYGCIGELGRQEHDLAHQLTS